MSRSLVVEEIVEIKPNPSEALCGPTYITTFRRISMSNRIETLAEKIERRESTNERSYQIVLNSSGKEFKQGRAAWRRRESLRNGADRRPGEKIVGRPSGYRTGVNTQPGRFAEAAARLRRFRETIASGVYGPMTSRAYFEHCIREVIRTQKLFTAGIVKQLRGQ